MIKKVNKLILFNTFGRKYEEFRPIDPREVKIYSCGPTVYWYQHIGNLRTYIFSDILKRVLEYDGYKIKHVINITDVGHLTSDADTGEDKMEKAIQKESKSASDIANYYLDIFRQDFKKLNIIEPSIWCKATDNIKEQIDLIKTLEEKGFTYQTKDGVYFNSSKFKDYGKLAKLKKEGLRPGERVDVKEKINSTDFALWKFSEKPGLRKQEWQSPWGLGFPGWHIECSAMAMKYLEETIDVHTGGIDHIPVHHTNEIAQSETATGKQFAKYWMHGAFLLFKGKKVSKSKGGLYTITELEKMGFKPLSYRYLCFTAHYRKPLDFSLDNLKNSQISYIRLKNIIAGIKNDKKLNKKYLEKFGKAVNNDLDMPKAVSVLWQLLRDKKATGKIKTIEEMEKVFGLGLFNREETILTEDAKKIIEEREKYRKQKNWKKSDELREKIEKMGYTIEDTQNGPKIKALNIYDK